MRWGAGAGASRLISGNMQPHRRLERAPGRVQGLRGGAALRLRLPRQHRHDRGARRRGRGRLLRRAQPRQHHRRLPALPGRDLRLPPRATSSTSPGACARRGERASLIVTDGVFSMDGDVAPLRGAGRAGPRPRLPADGRRGPRDRRARPGRARLGRRRRAQRRGRRRRRARSARRSAPTAPTSAPAARSIEYLLNTRPPLHLLDRAAAARRRRRLAALELLESAPASGSSGCAPTPPSCARRSPPRASRRAARRPRSCRSRSATPSRRWSSASALLERGVFAQGIRPPTVPEGSSRLRFTVMATHREGELRAAALIVGAAARELGIATAGDATGAVALAA